MKSALTLRDAKREEVPAIVRMLADDALGATRESPEAPLPQGYYDAFAAIAGDPNNRLLVAELDGELVGTMQLVLLRGMSHRGATHALIEAVRVVRSRRGQGLGRQMIGAAIEIARECGCHSVQLSSHRTRTDAHRFYEGLGFAMSHVGMKLALEPSNGMRPR